MTDTFLKNIKAEYECKQGYKPNFIQHIRKFNFLKMEEPAIQQLDVQLLLNTF